MEWLYKNGTTQLVQISNWSQENGIWTGWKSPPIPPALFLQWETLTCMLKGVAPIKQVQQDTFRWNPTTGAFSVKSCYIKLQDQGNTLS